MSTEAIDPKYANYKRPAALQQRLDAMRVVDGVAKNTGAAVAIVVGRWHNYIVDRLLSGALEALHENGVTDKNIDVINAPGAYEIPLVVKMALSGRLQLFHDPCHSKHINGPPHIIGEHVKTHLGLNIGQSFH